MRLSNGVGRHQGHPRLSGSPCSRVASCRTPRTANEPRPQGAPVKAASTGMQAAFTARPWVQALGLNEQGAREGRERPKGPPGSDPQGAHPGRERGGAGSVERRWAPVGSEEEAWSHRAGVAGDTDSKASSTQMVMGL